MIGDLGEADANVEHLCWGTGGSPVAAKNSVSSPSDKDSLIDKVIRTSQGNKADAELSIAEGDDAQEPLALLVVHAAMHMLFLPQFTCDYYEECDDESTLDKSAVEIRLGSARNNSDEERMTTAEMKQKASEEETQVKEDQMTKVEACSNTTKRVDNSVVLLAKPANIVWAAGCGVTPNQLGYEGGTRKFDKNRVEVLRLLLASCCDPLFSPADEYNPLASRWLTVAVAADAPNAICLFYSLMNTILSYDPNGLNVPYLNAFASDTHVNLVEISTQTLCVLLDCGLPGNPEPLNNSSGKPIVAFDEASKGGFNIFRNLLTRMSSGKELSFVYDGFVRLLKNTYESKNTYLPNSTQSLEGYQELLVLFWKMLEENPLFMNHIVTHCDVNEIIVPICYLMHQSRCNPAQIGLVHICTFILLKLSGERSFGVNLNKSFNTRLPCDLPLFSGGHSDLISITLHKLVVNGAYKLTPLYSCFITIICNISPYWRKMSLVAAVKIVNLFELFSSPRFLYSGENAHRHLVLLLEVLNNIIQYQYHGNHHLVYAIIRKKDVFGRLASLTLSKAIAQCNKVYDDQSTVQFDADAEDRKDIVSLTDVDEHGRPIKPQGKKDFPVKDNNDDEESWTGGSKSLDGSLDHSVDETCSVGSSIAGDRFQPTEDWLAELKESLPLETVIRLLQHLVPVVDEICGRKQGAVDEVEILEVLQEVTMVGLLPVPHAIVIRKYQPNQYTALWFTAFLWGVIFLRNQNLPIFDGEAIELFQVSVAADDDKTVN